MAIELESAVQLILENTKENKTTITIPLEKSAGCILYNDIKAKINQPPFNRSPLDGYALISSDTINANKKNPVKLEVIEEVFAGGYPQKQIKKGQATKIMTGAPIPIGADCVVKQEDTYYGSEQVLVYTQLKENQNFCFAGEDTKKDSIICKKGTKIDFLSMGVIASQGINEVTVYKKAKILLITTGDELVNPNEKLSSGKIYNSNLFALRQRLIDLNCDVSAIHIGDDYNKICKKIKSEYKDYNAIITTGGVSVGKKDIIHDVYNALGIDKIFWKVNLKPGTPAMFSVYDKTPILSLSGNPFASIVTFELLARPMVCKINHDLSLMPVKRKAKLENDFVKSSEKRRFIRAFTKDDKVYIQAKNHSSGAIGESIFANCLVDIKSNSKGLEIGDMVDIVLF